MRLGDLSANFDRAVWQRGLAYVQQGRVLELDRIDATGERWRAWVQGTAAYPYEVSLTLNPQPRRGQPLVQGECSCPVHFDCKHVVAAVCQLANDIADDPDAQAPEPHDGAWLDQWVGDLELSAHRSAAQLTKQVVFCMEVGPLGELDQHCHRVFVRPYGLRINKDGQEGSHRELDLDRAINQTRVPEWITLEVRQLWRGLRWLANRRTHLDFFELRPGSGELFGWFVGSGLCCAQAQPGGSRLRLGASKRGDFEWVLSANGRQSLQLVVRDEPGLDVVPLDPPYWWDRARGVCGPVECEVPSALQKTCFDAAALDAAVVVDEDVRARLLALGLPAPAAAAAELASQAPVAVVVVRSIVTGKIREELALELDYGGTRIAPNHLAPQVWGRRGEHATKIGRDTPAESRIQERLLQFGFEARQASHGLYEAPQEVWQAFVGELQPAMEKLGWRVELDASFRFCGTPIVDVFATVEDVDTDWFLLQVGIEVEGRRVKLLPALVDAIKAGLLAEDGVRIGAPIALDVEGRRVRLEGARMQRIVDILVGLVKDRGLQADALRLPMLSANLLRELDVKTWHGKDRARRFAQRLHDVESLQAPVLTGFSGTLRDYQSQGVGWMQLLAEYGLGGVLADDMGLGKTVQTLAHLWAEKQNGRAQLPSLVVAPVSVLRNWELEAQRFVPELRVLLVHGPGRAAALARIGDVDLVITSYALLQRHDELTQQRFHIVVLDEAQNIKNPLTKRAAAARALQANGRLALTGTPMENNLTELWSLMHFAIPGLLGGKEAFEAQFRRPIERGERPLADLSRRIAGFMLRRTKAQVLSELPPKTETTRFAELGRAQRDLYESVRLSVEKNVRRTLEDKGLGGSQVVILAALLKLRQVCCDPRLCKVDRASGAKSAKLQLLLELLEPLVAAGRRVLLFSQFTSMLALIEEALSSRKIDYLKLTGQTRDRQTLVDRFQEGDTPVFLISLKAGGVGLNLTAADTVIHYDPWWNPAVEQQATDRSHRFGQQRKVTVYKLVCQGTVEERILELQRQKGELIAGLQAGAEHRSAGQFSLKKGDIDALLAPL